MDIWNWTFTAVAIILGGIAFAGWRNRREMQGLQREKQVRTYVFASSLFKTLRQTYPSLTLKDCQLAARALRHFFLCHLQSGGQLIGMPSRIVDDLWHAFILDTRAYNSFFQDAFGQYFHHVPSGAMGHGPEADAALRRTWRHACREENIDPTRPTRLPLLFAIDEKLGIAAGFHYSLNKVKDVDQQRDTDSCRGGSSSCAGGPGRAPDHLAGHACSGNGLIGDSGSGSCSGGDSGCGGGCGGD